jgi:hypothetical protein
LNREVVITWHFSSYQPPRLTADLSKVKTYQGSQGSHDKTFSRLSQWRISADSLLQNPCAQSIGGRVKI